MAVGAQDNLDRLLVKKYSTKQVDNHEDLVSKIVNPEKMMDVMNDVADVQRTLLYMTNTLQGICAQVNAKARYKSGQRFLQRFNG